MIWLTWRQYRRQAVFSLIGLAALAALVIPTGLVMRHAFVHSGAAACVHAAGDATLVPGPVSACNETLSAFNSDYSTYGVIGVLFLVIPLLVGLFWGAPAVAREIEHGTHRLVWTQGISRRHWALVRFGMIGAAVTLLAVGYGLGVSWWLGPLSQAGQASRFNQFPFDMQGVVPIGYTLFAVALGAFAGTVWHKVLPAMAATMAGFLVLRVFVAVVARPRFMSAVALTYPVQGAGLQPNQMRGDWVLSNGVRDASGKMIAPHAEVICRADMQSPCGARLGIDPNGAYNWQLYQPAGRFWLFQGIETGIFVVLAALLVYLAVRRIRRLA